MTVTLKDKLQKRKLTEGQIDTRLKCSIIFAAFSVLFFLTAPYPAFASGKNDRTLNSVLGFQPPERIEFEMYRGGEKVGEHVISFSNTEDGLKVDISIDFVIRVLGFKAYEYNHSNQEIWTEDGLSKIETTTNDNGTANSLKAFRNENAYIVDGTAFKGESSANLLPTSYWNPAFLSQKEVLNTQDGEIMSITIETVDEEMVQLDGGAIPATRYRVIGDIPMEIWYDGNGNWVKLVFDAGGTDMIYQIKSPASGQLVKAE